ncbi:MAG: OmpA family protein [Methylococcales bacterium]
MKRQRSLDHDGLDGILQPVQKPRATPWFLSFWLVPALVVLAFGLYLLKKPPQATAPIEPPVSSVLPVLPSPIPVVSVPASTPIQTPASSATAAEQAVVADNSTKKLPPLAAEQPIPPATHAVSPAATPDALDNANNQPGSTAPPITAPSASTITGNSINTNKFGNFTVHFRFDSIKPNHLSNTARKQLLEMAKHCQTQLSVTGHTCNLGTDLSNQQLGLARANAVKKLLIKHGIPGQRIVTASAGMHNPSAPNDNRSGQSLNRRVELACIEP